ncbi:MAG: GlsB/YeaQ/YmgE family stress response membrane protein [Thermoleophilia bacterium]
MSLLAFLIVGLIAGWLAGMIMRGGGLGFIGDIVVGLIGAVIGGYLFSALGVNNGDSWIGWILTALVGSVILLLVVNLISGGSRRAVRH